ncbi:hypothetical protein ACHAPM_011755, partial [Fusarium culmorum]
AMANLASIFRDQGRWKEAEELEVQVVDARKSVLVEDHPSVLASKTNLALTYSNQGRWKEAEELQVGVVDKIKRVLGEQHPDTLTSMANLASTYSNQGRWKEAEELQIVVMERMKVMLGEEHPSTLTSMADLALTWKGLHLHVKALSILYDCVQLRQRILGSEHPDTVYARLTLGKWSNEGYKFGVPRSTVSDIAFSETPNPLSSNHGTSTNPSSLSDEAFVSQDRMAEGRPALTFFNYKMSETEHELSNIYDDVQSIASVSDDIDSLAEPDLGAANFRHAAVAYIVSMLTGNPELLSLYKQASRSMTKVKFVRNHRRLLKKYFLGLFTESKTASQRSAVEFLRFRPNRTQISQGIFDLAMPSNSLAQGQLSTILKQQNDNLVILDRFSSDRGTLERPTPSEAILEPDTQLALDDTSTTSEDSDEDGSINDQHSYQPKEESPLSNLEATAEFLVTGQPFRVYQDHLRGLLNPYIMSEPIEISQHNVCQDRSRVPERDAVEELSPSDIESKMTMTSWWFRLMNFCSPPPAGYIRISYLC